MRNTAEPAGVGPGAARCPPRVVAGLVAPGGGTVPPAATGANPLVVLPDMAGGVATLVGVAS